MSLWERLRRRSGRDEHPAAEWWEAGSPLPDAERRVEGVAFELGQVLWIQGRRGPKAWRERAALIEQILTSPRWRAAGYRWTSGDHEGRVTDAAANVLVRVRYQPATGGHAIERYQDGRLAQRTCFDDHGRATDEVDDTGLEG